MYSNTEITNHLHFSVIGQDDPKFMLLFDHSIYMNELPQNLVYDIISPGRIKAVRIAGIGNGITAISGSALDPTYTQELLGPAFVPDGIYRITQRVAPHHIFYCEKLYLRTLYLTKKMDEIYVAAEFHSRDANYTNWKLEMFNTESLIRTAEALCRLDNLKLSSEVYQTAQKEADKLYRMIVKKPV
jgi:hypothetical protein